MQAFRRLDATPRSPQVVAERLLAAIGGGLSLLKAIALIARGVPGPVSPPTIPPIVDAGFILAYALVGTAGLGVAFAWGAGAGRAARLALAGLLALLLDASGITAAPWVLPGVALLAAGGLASTLGGADEGRELSGPLRAASWIAVGGGLLIQVAIGGPLLVVGLAVPGYGVLGLYAVWGLLLALALRIRRTHPWLVPAIPPVTFAVIYRLLLLGGEVFGWTA